MIKNGIKRGKNGELFAVIFGGRGSEREISKRSGAAFIKGALALGYPILPVFVTKWGGFFLCSGGDSDIDKLDPDNLSVEAYPVMLSGKSGFLINGNVESVTKAVIIMHGDFGEDGSIQGALETAGIDYVGSSVGASAAAIDKYVAKCVARNLGIPTLDFKAYTKGVRPDDIEEDIGYPVFIKPRGLGSSIGASFARSRAELELALSDAFLYTDRIIAERCLFDKRELESAYLHLGDEVRVFKPGEVYVGGKTYSFSLKYSDKSPAELLVKASTDECINKKISEYSARLAEALGIRHFARFDYFLFGEDIYFNEVNTIPGMTEKSMFLDMLSAGGVDFASFLSLIFGEKP